MEYFTKFLSRQVEFERKENGHSVEVEDQFRKKLKSTVEDLAEDVREILKLNNYDEHLIFILFSFWWYQNEKVTGDWVEDLVDINGGKFYFVTEDQKPKLKKLIKEFKDGKGKYFNFTNYACKYLKKLPIFFKVLFDKDLKDFQSRGGMPCPWDGLKYEKIRTGSFSSSDKSVSKKFNTFFNVYEDNLPDAKLFYFIPAKGVKTNLLEQDQTKEESPGGLMLAFTNDLDDNFEKKVIPQLATLVSLCLNRLACIDFLILKERNENEIRNQGLKSAISAIMSRNGSHNLGSHVIFNVIKDIDKLKVQANKHLFKYLQQRMDFLAQISTAWVPDWTSSSWLVKEIMKGFLEQEHILNYIARAEGLQAQPKTDTIRKISKFILRQKKKDGGYKREIIIQMDIGAKCPSDEDTDTDQDSMGLDKDFLIAIPGSNIGFHALYTIIENFIRNAAKHEFSALPLKYQKQKSLKVNLEIEENDDGKSYTVTLWDNLSYLSTNLDDSKVDDEQFLGEVSLKDKDLKKLKFEKVLEGNETKKASETGPKGPEYKAKIITVILEDDGIKIQIDGKDEFKQELHNLFTEINSKHRVFIVHPYDEYNGFKRPMKLEKFEAMIGKPNVRFISEPRWSCFLDGIDWPKGNDDKEQKRIRQDTIKQKLVKLLQDAWQPTHKKLNSDLSKKLINKDGSLKRENWGLSEMKICASYLQKEKISKVGQGGKDVMDIIKAVPVPEYIKRMDSTKGIRAYRMGYQFKLYKPKEVLVIGVDGFGNNAIRGLEQQSIYVKRDFNEVVDLDFEFVVISGNAVEDFVNRLSDGDKHKFIETFPYRIVLVSNSNKNISIIDEDDFLKKRVSVCNEKVLIGENSGLAKHLENCAKNNKNSAKELSNAEEFKLKVYEAWVKHIKENVRGLKDEIYVVVKPTDDSTETDDSDFSEFLGMLDKMLVEPEGNKLYLSDDEKLILHEKCEKALREHFGFYKKNYQPATLPDPPFSNVASGDEGKIFAYSFKECLGNDLKWPDAFKNCGTTKHEKTISYIRHAHLCAQTCCSENHTPIYDEKTGGAAAHFPILSNIPSKEERPYLHINTILKLIENGLLRIAIADERSWDYLAERQAFAEELTLCGVYPVRQLLTFKMPGEAIIRHNVNVLEIKINNHVLEISAEGNVMLDIVIIHQGILDKIEWSNTIYKDGGQDAFVKDLKDKIPMVIVTSGRGEPSNLSRYAKFMGFSIFEQHVISDPHSKLILTDSLMKLSRNYERKENKS